MKAYANCWKWVVSSFQGSCYNNFLCCIMRGDSEKICQKSYPYLDAWLHIGANILTLKTFDLGDLGDHVFHKLMGNWEDLKEGEVFKSLQRSCVADPWEKYQIRLKTSRKSQNKSFQYVIWQHRLLITVLQILKNCTGWQ